MLDGVEMTEDRISELEDRSITLIQYEQKRVEWKQMNRALGTCETITTNQMFISLESQRKIEREGLKEHSKR